MGVFRISQYMLTIDGWHLVVPRRIQLQGIPNFPGSRWLAVFSPGVGHFSLQATWEITTVEVGGSTTHKVRSRVHGLRLSGKSHRRRPNPHLLPFCQQPHPRNNRGGSSTQPLAASIGLAPAIALDVSHQLCDFHRGSPHVQQLAHGLLAMLWLTDHSPREQEGQHPQTARRKACNGRRDPGPAAPRNCQDLRANRSCHELRGAASSFRGAREPPGVTESNLEFLKCDTGTQEAAGTSSRGVVGFFETHVHHVHGDTPCFAIRGKTGQAPTTVGYQFFCVLPARPANLLVHRRTQLRYIYAITGEHLHRSIVLLETARCAAANS
mmetsp:Transcript_115004/g.199471  ORF Transcript_115004/g.199471 Transcript_115004/m.199471 type:complete len:324 (+) Transcript_115004:641-1612(+)